MSDAGDILAPWTQQGQDALRTIEAANQERDGQFLAKALEAAGEKLPDAPAQISDPESPALAKDAQLDELSRPPANAAQYDLEVDPTIPGVTVEDRAKAAELFHAEGFDRVLATAAWTTVIREVGREYDDAEIESSHSEGWSTLTRRHGSAGAKAIVADAQRVLDRLVTRMPELKGLRCPALSNAELIEMLAMHERRNRKP